MKQFSAAEILRRLKRVDQGDLHASKEVEVFLYRGYSVRIYPPLREGAASDCCILKFNRDYPNSTYMYEDGYEPIAHRRGLDKAKQYIDELLGPIQLPLVRFRVRNVKNIQEVRKVRCRRRRVKRRP